MMDYLNKMEEAAKEAHGTSFVLAMADDEGNVTIHPRNNQPCQGGETRKYIKTHGAACTQPENAKPGDLHNPFPDGKVVAIAFPKATFNHTKGFDFFHRVRDVVTMSKESPFRTGFKDVRTHEDGVGFTVGDTRVDPTVMIQGIQLIRNMHYSMLPKFSKEQVASLSDLDLLFLAMNWYDVRYECSSGYYWNSVISPKRFYQAMPNDLSGGTYHDGFDYNRSFNADLFVPSVGDASKPGLDASSLKFSTTDLVKRSFEVLEAAHKFMETEEDPVKEPYKFRTYSGKTYDSHLDYLKEVGKL